MLVAVLVLAVLFDYINGFHDTANAIATSVSTRALRPDRAILLSAAANFVGALTGTAVATTIGSGLVRQTDTNQAVIAAALPGSVNVDGVRDKVLVPLVTSPILGLLIGFLLMVVLLNVFRRSNPHR